MDAIEQVPSVISIRTKRFKPLLAKWRRLNRRVPWRWLLDDALKRELRPLAGKRHAHLVNMNTNGRRAA